GSLYVKNSLGSLNQTNYYWLWCDHYKQYWAYSENLIIRFFSRPNNSPPNIRTAPISMSIFHCSPNKIQACKAAKGGTKKNMRATWWASPRFSIIIRNQMAPMDMANTNQANVSHSDSVNSMRKSWVKRQANKNTKNAPKY